MRSRAINWIVKVQGRKMIAAFLQFPGFPLSVEGKVVSLSHTNSLCVRKKKSVQVKSLWPLYHHSLASIDDSVPQGTQPSGLPPLPTALLPFLILTQPSRGKVQSQDPTLATDSRTNSPRRDRMGFPVPMPRGTTLPNPCNHWYLQVLSVGWQSQLRVFPGC